LLTHDHTPTVQHYFRHIESLALFRPTAVRSGATGASKETYDATDEAGGPMNLGGGIACDPAPTSNLLWWLTGPSAAGQPSRMQCMWPIDETLDGWSPLAAFLYCNSQIINRIRRTQLYCVRFMQHVAVFQVRLGRAVTGPRGTCQVDRLVPRPGGPLLQM